jgi:hypothetical protein
MLGAGPAGAVVYTFGDATLSAAQVDVRLREREAVATGAPHVTKGDWEARADSITLAFDDQRRPTRIDLAGNVGFRGKLVRKEPAGARPFADTVRANCASAKWVADPGSAAAGRADEGVLTLSGNARLEALYEGEVAATVDASTIVARLNSGEIAASERATMTRSGSTTHKDEATGADVVVRYTASLAADKVDLRWDPDTQLAVSSEARGSVKLRYVREDTKKGTKTAVTGVCDAASWRRDPDWKGDPADDQGIALLRGSVSAESVTDEAGSQARGEGSKIVCETLTYYLNERRAVAEGGPQEQVDLTVGGGE